MSVTICSHAKSESVRKKYGASASAANTTAGTMVAKGYRRINASASRHTADTASRSSTYNPSSAPAEQLTARSPGSLALYFATGPHNNTISARFLGVSPAHAAPEHSRVSPRGYQAANDDSSPCWGLP